MANAERSNLWQVNNSTVSRAISSFTITEKALLLTEAPSALLGGIWKETFHSEKCRKGLNQSSFFQLSQSGNKKGEWNETVEMFRYMYLLNRTKRIITFGKEVAKLSFQNCSLR